MRFGRPALVPRVRSATGVSLVEATIMLGVVATLAAALAPTINDWITAARIARARQDVRIIAEAIQQFLADTGESEFLQVGKGTSTNYQPPANRNSPVRLLVSDGDIPVLGPDVAGNTFWTLAVNGDDVDTLSNHLIENAPGENAGDRYRTPADLRFQNCPAGSLPCPGGNNIDFARADSSGFNAPHAWRGPYLRSPVNPDPWGYRYAVNVFFLEVNSSWLLSMPGGITGSFTPADIPRLDVFVLSAGPDREIDTPVAQDGAVPGDDDIIHIVSPNAK